MTVLFFIASGISHNGSPFGGGGGGDLCTLFCFKRVYLSAAPIELTLAPREEGVHPPLCGMPGAELLLQGAFSSVLCDRFQSVCTLRQAGHRAAAVTSPNLYQAARKHSCQLCLLWQD